MELFLPLIPLIVKIAVGFWLVYPLVGKVLGEFWWRAWKPQYKNTWRAKIAFPLFHDRDGYGRHEYCEFPGWIEDYYPNDDDSRKGYLLFTAFLWPVKFVYWLCCLIISVSYHIVTAPWNFEFTGMVDGFKDLFKRTKPKKVDVTSLEPQDKLSHLQAEKVRIETEMKEQYDLLGLSPDGKSAKGAAFRVGNKG